MRDELIGPSLGDELRQKALIALGVALLAQLLYLAVRFRWTFGGAAVLAMLHDVVIVIGVFAWLGKPIDGVFLAALLTVIGYSVNDSVVVFDRVREMRAADREVPFAQRGEHGGPPDRAADGQHRPGRGVHPGGAGCFVGGDSLADFALALLLGVAVGTYSSVFTATPLAVVFDARSPHIPAAPVRRRAPRTPAPVGQFGDRPPRPWLGSGDSGRGRGADQMLRPRARGQSCGGRWWRRSRCQTSLRARGTTAVQTTTPTRPNGRF